MSLSKTLSFLSAGSTEEDLSPHDCKIAGWVLKNLIKQETGRPEKVLT